MKNNRNKIGLLFRSRALSPKGFLVRGLLIALVYGILESAGFRGYTMILSGTSPTADAGDYGVLIRGCLYILSYWAFVVLAPILILAAGLFHLFVSGRIFHSKTLP